MPTERFWFQATCRSQRSQLVDTCKLRSIVAGFKSQIPSGNQWKNFAKLRCETFDYFNVGIFSYELETLASWEANAVATTGSNDRGRVSAVGFPEEWLQLLPPVFSAAGMSRSCWWMGLAIPGFSCNVAKQDQDDD